MLILSSRCGSLIEDLPLWCQVIRCICEGHSWLSPHHFHPKWVWLAEVYTQMCWSVSERMACLETKVCKWTGTREAGNGIAALVLLPLLLLAKFIPPGWKWRTSRMLFTKGQPIVWVWETQQSFSDSLRSSGFEGCNVEQDTWSNEQVFVMSSS